MLVLYEEGLVQGQVQCWIDLPAPWQWQLYLTLVAVSLLVLPALLIFACYIVIVRTIWVQSAALTASMPSTNRNNNNTAGTHARVQRPSLFSLSDKMAIHFLKKYRRPLKKSTKYRYND